MKKDEGIRYEVIHVKDSHAVRTIRVNFGDGHQVEISQYGRKTTVRLVGREIDLTPDASERGCEFERAVNLLRLHMGRTS